MATLSIRNILGKQVTLVEEDGTKIYEAAQDFLSKGQSVTLDFSGMERILSAVFHTSIGQLSVDFGQEAVKNLVGYTGMPASKADKWLFDWERAIHLGTKEHRSLYYQGLEPA
ncbi:STAS-like domain-containing protein [Nostoc sp. NIES-2111]